MPATVYRHSKAAFRTIVSSLVVIALLLGSMPFAPLKRAEAISGWYEWPAFTTGTDLYINDVCYADGHWVYVGGNNLNSGVGVIATSSNGVTWLPASVQNAPCAFLSVLYTGARWLAFGSAGTVFSSVDTMSWSLLSKTTNANNLAAACNGSTVVTLGQDGAISTSTDGGLTWRQTEPAKAPGSNYYVLADVIFADGGFTAVGSCLVNPSDTLLYSSSDGLTWTSGEAKVNPFGYVPLSGAAYHDGVYVAVGTVRIDATHWNSAILTSVDNKETWSKSELASGSLVRVACCNNEFVAVGINGTILSSSDGLIWNTESVSWQGTNPTGSDFWPQDIYYANGLYVAVGSNGTLVTKSIYSDNTDLSSLAVTDMTLDPEFSSDNLTYTLPATTATALSVTASTADSNATLTVNGKPAASGAATSVPLSFGQNTISVVVTAQDGYTTKTYEINTQGISSELSGLTLSSGTLSPAFSPKVTSYAVDVRYSETSIMITPYAVDPNASIKVNGASVSDGHATSVALPAVGPNTVTVVVAAQDGGETTYTMTVTRAQASNNANLSGLTISAGTLAPQFALGTTTYTADVLSSSIGITPTAADSFATIEVNGTASASGHTTNVPLSFGSNTLSIVVTAEDSTTTKTYSLTVNRPSDDATLSSLLISAGALSPAFSPAVEEYTATVSYPVASLGVTPTPADPGATVKINGAATTGGTAANTVLGVGANTIAVEVLAPDKATVKTYTINVTRAAPSIDSSLRDLTLSAGTLAPAFASSTNTYTATVGTAVTSIGINASVNDPVASIKINGHAASSGVPSSVPLSLGDNLIMIEVTAEDGSGTVYTVSVRRLSNNADLASLNLSRGALSPGFSAGVTSYTADVPYEVNSVTVTATVSDSAAGLKVNDQPSASDSVSIPLAIGANQITAQVTAEDGTIKTYTVAVTRAPLAFSKDDINTKQLVSVGAGLGSLRVPCPSGETLTFVVSDPESLPAGITLNPNGSFSGRVTTVGVTSAEIGVTGNLGGQASTTLTVTVQPAPAFTAAPANTSQLVSVGASLTPLRATGASGETLTFSLAGGALPPGVTGLNSDGTFAGAVTTLGTTTAIVNVTDTHGGSASAELKVTVQECPVFTAQGTNTFQLVSTGAGLTPLAVTAAPDEVLTFAVISGSLPDGITINGDGSFSGTVTSAGQTTSATIQVKDDHGGIAETTLQVETQMAPAFTSDVSNTSQLISTSACLSRLSVVAAPGESLTFSSVSGSLPVGVSLNADGSFFGAATMSGSFTVTIKVADEHGGSASTTLKADVQMGPHFTGDVCNTTQYVTVAEGLKPLAVTSTAGETLIFNLTAGTLAPGITINAASGSFTGVTTTPGAWTADIRAADTHGGSCYTTLAVYVREAPAFTAAVTNGSQQVSAGGALTAMKATVAPGETTAFSLAGGSLPDGVTLQTDGSFAGAPTTTGVYSASIAVVDSRGAIATTSLIVTVQVAPAFTADPCNTSQLVSVGATLNELKATCASGDSLTFTVVGGTLPMGLDLNGDGTFSGEATTPGDRVITVRAADAHGGKATTSLRIVVQPGPTFTSAPANIHQLVSVGAGLAAFEVTKAEGETLTYSIVGGALPPGITMDANGVFAGRVTVTGDTTASIQITDTHGGRATTALLVTVQQPPSFTGALSNSSQTTSTGAGLTPLEATAAAGETTTFTLAGGILPAGITLNPDGTFAGAATAAGSNSANIKVADSHGGVAVTTLVVEVLQGPVYTADAFNTRQSVGVGGALHRLAANGDVGQVLRFALASGNLPTGVTLNPDGSFTGNTGTAGTYNAVIEVVDNRGGKATTNLSVVVFVPKPAQSDATPPVISLNGAAEVTVEVGSTFSEPGASATDNKDGDISGSVVVSGAVDTGRLGRYTVTYSVADAAGNRASTSRVVRVVDTTRPTVTLNGSGQIALKVGEPYSDAGAAAFDNYDGDITSSVTISGSVDTARPGLYTLTYSVFDSSGNSGTARRTVFVTASEVMPVIETPTVTADEIGRKLDSYVLGETTISAIESAVSNGLTKVELVLAAATSDVSDDDSLSAAIDVTVPNVLLQAAKSLDVQVTTNLATLELPPELVSALAFSGQELHIRMDRPTDTEVRAAAGADVELLTDPVDISTTLVGRTMVSIPCGLELPADEAERQGLLASLGMFVVHSDGTEQTIHNLKFDIDGSTLRSVSFWVDRFSTFVLVRTTRGVKEPTVLTTLISSRSYTVRGGVKDFDSETAFYGKQGVTVMALRLFQELGARFEYVWKPEGGVITMSYKDVVVTLTEGARSMQVQDSSCQRTVSLRTEIVNRGGRAFIPTRDVSENLGFSVEWHAADDSITITEK